jgi:uncharacterized cupin superfamily protein
VGVDEAPLRRTKHGLVADVDGWFVVNARDSRWRDYGPFGKGCDFEGKRSFKQMGINVTILAPGESLGVYHHERHQEGFLVVSGQCLLIVEGMEKQLRTWDFFHCPGGTAHVLIGAGDSPAIVLAVGARGGRKGLVYPVDQVALAHGAGAEQETTNSAEAYAPYPHPRRSAYGDGWLPTT